MTEQKLDAAGLWRLFREHSSPYTTPLAARLPVVSTTTYVLTCLFICIPPILLLIFFEVEAAKLRSEEPKGCRKLGIRIDSNLTNEFDPKFSKGFPASTEETSADWWRIKSLWMYPVKSCQGVELQRGTLLATGMQFDRQFTFAELRSPFSVAIDATSLEKTAHKWEVLTQERCPLLAQIRTEIWIPDQSIDTYSPHAADVESGGVIIMSFPYQQAGWRGTLAKWGAQLKGTVPEKHFRIPFNPTVETIEKSGYAFEDLTVWQRTIHALNLEIDLPEELRYFLGLSNKLGLFRIDDRKLTACGLGDQEAVQQPLTSFQDAYPLHFINLASVRDVESRVLTTQVAPRLSVGEFRANIIITGPEKHMEESWKKLKIGFYEYDIACHARDEESTAPEQGEKPTWASGRSRRMRFPQIISDATIPRPNSLGMLMVPLSRESAIKVGDELIVLEHE